MEKRVPIYLHLPLQVLWFDTHEIAILIIFYLFAAVFGGVAWFLIILGPAFVIPIKRRKPRGWFFHQFHAYGFVELEGYPLPTENKFRE